MGNAGVRVSLKGMGSDDLLFSEHDDVEAALDAAAARLDLRRYWELRRVLRGLVGGNLHIERAGILGELRWFARRELARLKLLVPLRAVRARLRLLRLQLRSDFTQSEMLMPTGAPVMRSDPGPNRRNAAAWDSPIAGMSPLQAKYFTDLHVRNLPFLTNWDRSSMAHSIEVRMPFMDWRLVTLGVALPDASKNGGGYTKRVLRIAMEGLVPDSIRLRTNKIAFVSPLDDWARGALKPWLLDISSSRSFLESVVWNGPAVRAIVERAATGQGSLWPVWPILQAHVLERMFIARACDTDG
jgi:asparagine synthetase B (glutamine-hydrolysing)